MDTPALRPVFDSVAEHNRGRDPRRLALKLDKLAASAFSFFRGACHRFYEELPLVGVTRDAPAAWICGDLHLENFGSYKGDNRLVYFDVNDFDEACLAPVTWDIVRFQASVFLAATGLGLREGSAAELAARFSTTYAEVLAQGHARWVERRTARGVVRRLLRSLSRRSQSDLLDERAPVRGGKRRLRVGGEADEVKALQADPARRARVKEALRAHALALGAQQQLRVLDVQDRVAGTGSLGLERYVVLTQGDGPPDGSWLLDAKALPPSAPARLSPCRQPEWTNDAERATTLQRALQAVPPARLATLQIGSTPYVLRELLPSEDRVDHLRAARKPDRLQDLLEDMAQVVAWAHLRAAGRRGAAGPDDLMAFGRDPRWQTPLLDLARQRARASQLDHAQFVEALRMRGGAKGARVSG